MASRTLHPLIQQFLQRVGRESGGGIRDGQLLERFVILKDEAAFETIVWRHAALVLGTCQRILHDRHDAEDAFQATFLLLFRKAASINRRDSLSNWLFKVAYRVALKARARLGPRPGEAELVEPAVPESSCDLIWRDLRAVLDEQLDRLPEKYRAPLVLHYLEGKTVEQVARELGWPQGTVAGRLHRARHLLRKRLVHQGMTLSATTVGIALAHSTASAQPPAGLVASTLHAATLCAAGKAATVSAAVTALTQGVLQTMWHRTMKVAVTVAAAFCLLAGGGGFLVYHALADQDKAAAATGSRSPERPQGQKDLPGDPLPSGAIARLGTPRLRQPGLGGPYYDPGTVAFLPDGKTLFSAGCWSFRFWDTATGRKIGGIDLEKDELPQKNTLAACALAPDGKTLALTMRYEATIRLVNAATGKDIRRFEGHARGNGTRSVTRIDMSPDGKTLASVATDGTIRLWEVATGKQIRQLQPFDPVKRIAVGLLGDIKPWVKFSPDGKMLVSKDGTNVRLWEVVSGKEIRRLGQAVAANPQGPQGPGMPGKRPWPGSPEDAAFSPDGKIVAVGHAGSQRFSRSSICLWEILTGKKIREIEAPAPVLAVAFSADGKMLAAAGGSMPYRGIGVVVRPPNDHGIHLYDWTTGKLLRQLVGHNRAVYSLAFSPDSKTLASAAGDSTVRLWNPATGKEIRPGGAGNEMWVETVAFSADGKTVASAGRENAIVLWEADTGKFIRRIVGAPPRVQRGALFNDKVWSLAFSPDGKTLASGSGDTSLYLWNPATGKQIRRLDGHKHWVRSVVFSPDGKTLASGSEDKTVRLWDPATGKQLLELGGHGHGVRSVAFSRDGKMLASGSEHTIRLWDPATGKPIPHKADKLAFDALCLALSPDGKTVAVGGGHGAFELVLVDLATGKEKGRCRHTDAVWSVAFSPDGKLVASASHDHKVCLCDAATGKEIRRLDGQQGPVFSVAFSPDGKVLASGGEDTTVLLWDVARLSGRARGPARPTDRKPLRPTDEKSKSADKKSVKPGDQEPPRPLTAPADKKAVTRAAGDWEPLWTALAGDDAGKAYDAIAVLAAAPKQAVPFLQERLRVRPPADPQRLARWIADLESANYLVRQKATEELGKLGEAAEAALRKAQAQKPALEASRRLEQLLAKIETPSGDLLRQLRAIQVLEYAGTPEAKRLLGTLARGAAGARLTREAQASLQRLLKQTPSAAPAP